MPNIAGIYGVSFEAKQSAVSRRRRMFSSMAVVPLFREQYRLVDNSILLLVCLGRSVDMLARSVCIVRNVNESLSVLCKGIDKTRPMIRAVKEPIGVLKLRPLTCSEAGWDGCPGLRSRISSVWSLAHRSVPVLPCGR
jgi:hypothetical protein